MKNGITKVIVTGPAGYLHSGTVVEQTTRFARVYSKEKRDVTQYTSEWFPIAFMEVIGEHKVPITIDPHVRQKSYSDYTV